MTAQPSPPAARQRLPSWLDLRLVAGVLLVLVSVLVGAKVVAAGDRTVRVWSVSRDLAAGTILARDDLRPVRVRLLDNAGRYLAVSRSAVGRTLTRDLGTGELLPLAALSARPCGSEVSIPVPTQHIPVSVRRGSRIDVYATTKGTQAQQTVQVLRGVTVQAVLKPTSGLLSANASWSVIVRVPTQEAGAVVKALRTADIDVTVVAGAAANDGCGSAPPGGVDPAPSGAVTPSTPPAGTAPTPTPQPTPSRSA